MKTKKEKQSCKEGSVNKVSNGQVSKPQLEHWDPHNERREPMLKTSIQIHAQVNECKSIN